MTMPTIAVQPLVVVSSDSVALSATGVFVAACLVVAAAGYSKVRDPHPAAGALVALGMSQRMAPLAARGAGAAELVAGAGGLALGRVGVVMMLAVCAGLVVVASGLRARAPGADCGCLGVSASRGVGGAHLAVTSAFLVVSALLFATSRGATLDGPLVARLCTVALASVLAWVAASVIKQGPMPRAAARGSEVAEFGPVTRGAAR